MKKLLILTICLWVTACAIPNRNGPGMEHGLSTAGTGLGHLLLSPFQIAAGLLEGIASLPYYVAGSLYDINEGFEQAHADITLGETYQTAYGTTLNQVREDGNTGMIFSKMSQATAYFQKVLQQVPNNQHYILTSVDSRGGEYVLLAVIYRPYTAITVIDKYNNQTVRQLTLNDRAFYEPFQVDSYGQALDQVVDWAALPKDSIETQKAQAILLTLAANSVAVGKRSSDYWQYEQRWLAGQEQAIVKERENELKHKMGM